MYARKAALTLSTIGMLLLAAGCGSRVAERGLAGSTSSSLDSLGGVTSAPAPGSPSDSVAVTTGTVGASTAEPDVPTAPPVDVTQTAPVSTPLAASSPIKIGIPYAKNSGAALSALGGTSSDAPDQSAMFRAVINDANRHGGIAGHRIVPVFFGIDVTGDQASQYQGACAAFTQDNKVFAAIGIGGTAYYTCLQKAGVIVLTDPDGDSTEQAQWPLQVSPNNIVLDRVARTFVLALQNSDYLAGRPRIGVLTYNVDSYARVSNSILLPALKHADPGLVVASVPRAQTASDLVGQQSAVSNAVLRFHSAGVNHVVFFVDGGLPESSFANDAQSQGFAPRYAYTSLDELEATIEGGLFSSASKQLAGSIGFGWTPIFDTVYPNPFLETAAAKHCLAVGASGGVVPKTSIPAGQLAQACDGIRILQIAGTKASAVTATSFVQAIRNLGTSFASAATQLTSFTGNRDGAAAYQQLSFDPSCTCIKPTGSVREASR